jgi:hypothetical protein
MGVLLLALCSLVLMPGSADGADLYDSPFGEYGYRTHGSGSSGDPYWSEILSFDASEAYVEVQSALEGYPMTEITGGSFGMCRGMTDLVLPKTLERVGAGAFADCVTLERIYFLGDRPDIGSDAIPGDVEVYRLQGTRGWGPEAEVLPLYIRSGDGGSFSYYVLNGGAAVHALVTGTDIIIPQSVPADGTAVRVTTIGDEAFRNSKITSVNIPDTVTRIGVRAFYGCHELMTAELPPSLMTVCDEAFRECGKLGNVDLHDAVFIGFEAFRMCYSFTDVIIPDSVSVMKCGAFRVCYSMESLTIGSGITDIPDSAFDYCQSLKNVDIRGKVKSVGKNAFFNAVNFMPALERISLPDVEIIGDSAFYGCINLTDVVVGGDLREIGPYAFYDCRSLSPLSLPASLEKVGDMAFCNDRNLSDIYFAGKMPEFGRDVFAGTDTTVHCTEKNVKSWAGFEGRLAVESDGGPDYAVPAVIIAVLILVAAGAFAVMRSGSKGGSG